MGNDNNLGLDGQSFLRLVIIRAPVAETRPLNITCAVFPGIQRDVVHSYILMALVDSFMVRLSQWH